MESRSLLVSLITYAVMLVRWPWICQVQDGMDLDEEMEDADSEEVLILPGADKNRYMTFWV